MKTVVIRQRVRRVPAATAWLACVAVAVWINACSSGDDASSQSDAAVTDTDGSAASSDGLLITLEDGRVQGDALEGSRRFLKIPYAKPPVGDLRWHAPVKNEPWDGVRHEKDFSGACAQNQNSQGPASSNEDCLYLNVWAPEAPVKKAPVMVWIHGGGNFAGGASDKVPVPGLAEADKPLFYDGQFFASRHGIVLVSINYRLGPLGFFAHPGLADEDSPQGNQGLRDQRQALEWVRDNIAAFGGDPKNVTIFGESAGSADVCFHVASPLSRGLFARAISESGGCAVAFGRGKENALADAEKQGVAFAKLLGCDSASDPLACLRKKPIAEVMAHAMQPDPMGGSSPSDIRFGPIVDGEFLPDQPRTLFETGKVAKVPYLLGSNSDEGKLFVLSITVSDEAAYKAELTRQFGADANAIAAQYPASRFNGNYHDALARVVGDSGLGCGTDATARSASAAGLSVYVYNFDMAWSIAPSFLGASHGSEISHVFGTPYKPSADDVTVSDAMNAYWAQFAKTGDPNGKDSPTQWPLFKPSTAGGDKRIQFDPKFPVLSDFRKDDCAFWRGIYDQAWKP